jgi:tetratricopeptide (TPR) repeat protein
MCKYLIDSGQYKKIRGQLIRKAQFQYQQLNQNVESYWMEIFDKMRIHSVGGAMVGGKRTNIYTPSSLQPLLERLFLLPAELSAWMVMKKLGDSLRAAGLPVSLQGDIQMACENANYVLPDKIDKAARHLACSLCISPTLHRARSLLTKLGLPFSEGRLSAEEIVPLVRQGYLPENVMVSMEGLVRIGWNMEMRKEVFKALLEIVPQGERLFQIQRQVKMQQNVLRRWKHQPLPEADALLQQGIDEQDLEKAYGLLEQAGKMDPILMPDVLRNQAWILTKRGRLQEAVNLCDDALDIDPEYAEVWYQMGICTAKSGNYELALGNFLQAKSLGLRKQGLESNIASCRQMLRRSRY